VRTYDYVRKEGPTHRKVGEVRLETQVKNLELMFRDAWRIEDGGTRLRWGMKADCDKTGLMRPLNVIASGSDSDELSTYRMRVMGSRAVIQDDRREQRAIDFPEGMVTDAALWRIVALLPREIGRRWGVGHVLELSELNLKKGGVIVCEGRSEVTLHGESVQLWRYTYRRDDLVAGEFWVDGERDALRMFRLDGRKLFVEREPANQP
jgi:hypothetical protein